MLHQEALQLLNELVTKREKQELERELELCVFEYVFRCIYGLKHDKKGRKSYYSLEKMFGVLFGRNQRLESYYRETKSLESYNSQFLATRRGGGHVDKVVTGFLGLSHGEFILSHFPFTVCAPSRNLSTK